MYSNSSPIHCMMMILVLCSQSNRLLFKVECQSRMCIYYTTVYVIVELLYLFEHIFFIKKYCHKRSRSLQCLNTTIKKKYKVRQANT